MSILARSSLLLSAGFAAGVAASTAVAVFATTRQAPLPATEARHYSVSIDEIRQNLVFGDFFNDHYTRTVTLSDGSVHRVTLTATSKNGQPLLELTDASGGRVAHSFMGPFGTTTNGKLMINVKDDDEIRTEMHRVAGR
jgi:hypothetical protein